MDVRSLADSHLVALLGEDNPAAFKELYERHWYSMYRLAAQKTGRKDIAEEMAQQLFEALWIHRGRLRIDNVKAYLTKALKNLVVDHIRRHILEENYLGQLQSYFPESYSHVLDEVQMNELTRTVSGMLLHLPPKTQQVFTLSRLEQLTIPEIALRLSLSEKAIEYHLSRALRFLRRHLGEYISTLLWAILL